MNASTTRITGDDDDDVTIILMTKLKVKKYNEVI